jgi:membrane associated rhomboid family serine protease
MGLVYVCPSCGGHAASLSVLRKVFGPERVAVIWGDLGGSTGCACPACRQSMRQVTWIEKDQPIALNLCRQCEIVWFDPNEYESIAPAPPKPPAPGEIDITTLSPDQREKLAMARLKMLQYERESTDGPQEEWKSLPGLFGLPVELDTVPNARVPIATYIVTALIAAVSLLEFLAMQTTRPDVIKEWGLVPADWARDGGLTLVTSFFMHGGIFHLVSNLYFLVIFGRHVEQFLGSARWLVLLATAALVGDAVDIAFTWGSTVPLVGASGGISGLLAFYALKFPHARLALMMRYFYSYQWLTISAWSAFGIWILLQLFGAYLQMKNQGDVASLAHLGGVLAGLGAWALWKNLDARPAASAGGIRVQVQ